MRSWMFSMSIAMAAAVVAGSVASSQPAPDDPGADLVGKPAPEIVLRDANGKSWKLSELKGKKVVVLDFGRTFCVGCRDTAKDLQQIHKAYKGKGVQVLTVCINAGDLDTVKQFIKDLKLTFPVLRDVELKAAKAYDLQMIPLTVLVQKSGYVHWVHTGHPANYSTLVRGQLDGLLAPQ